MEELDWLVVVEREVVVLLRDVQFELELVDDRLALEVDIFVGALRELGSADLDGLEGEEVGDGRFEDEDAIVVGGELEVEGLEGVGDFRGFDAGPGVELEGGYFEGGEVALGLGDEDHVGELLLRRAEALLGADGFGGFDALEHEPRGGVALGDELVAASDGGLKFRFEMLGARK